VQPTVGPRSIVWKDHSFAHPWNIKKRAKVGGGKIPFYFSMMTGNPIRLPGLALRNRCALHTSLAVFNSSRGAGTR